jgi:hypothetical protein
MNSEGSEIPTGLTKLDGDWYSTGIKISAARAYQGQERARGKKFEMKFEKSNAEWALGG